MALIFKVQIVGITKPPVWRRIAIKNDATFYGLHDAIQRAFNWGDYHLWCFQPTKRLGQGWRIEPEENDDGWLEPAESPEMEIRECALPIPFYYLYDFGDHWLHSVKYEKSEEMDLPHGCKLLASKGEAPEEDSGGIYEYMNRRDHPEEYD